MTVKKSDKTTEKAKKTTKTDKTASEKKVVKATKKEIKKNFKKTVKKILKAKEKNEKLLKKAAKPKENAEEKKIVALIEKTLSNGKAEDITVINLTGKTAIADYLVIATGRAPRHVTALAEQVQLRLKKTGVPASIEGEDVGDWVIVDAGDVIVHVFHPETRELYCIEELWGEETPRRSTK